MDNIVVEVVAQFRLQKMGIERGTSHSDSRRGLLRHVVSQCVTGMMII